MKEKIFPKVRTGIFIKAIFITLGFFVGLIFTAQLRSFPLRSLDPVVYDAELKEIITQLSQQQSDLKKQFNVLKKEIDKDQQKVKGIKISSEFAEELDKLKNYVGLKNLSGEGVVVTLDDSRLFKEGQAEDFIIHAADLRDIINVLWQASAEAIAINGERIAPSTSIDCISNTILVNYAHLAPPYYISAIGDKDKLLNYLKNNSLLRDIYNRKIEKGIQLEINSNDKVVISSYNGVFNIEYSQLVEE